MTTTMPPPSPQWLVRLLAHCTVAEQRALDRYRDSLRCGFDDVRAGLHSSDQMLTHWRRLIDTLEDAACGSPPFDSYVSRQRDRLATAKTRTSVDAT